MIYVGIDNYVNTASATSTATGYSADNALTAEGSVWRGNDNDDTLTITLDQDRNVNLICLHGVKGQQVDLTTKLNGGTVGTETVNVLGLSGIDYKSIYFTLTGYIDQVIFRVRQFDGDPVEVAYVWAGSKVDIEEESVQDFLESTDTVNLTLGNLANSTGRYDYRAMNVTTAKMPATELKYKMETIIKSGYGIPRAISRVTADCIPEVTMLGVLDSGKVGYDYFLNLPIEEPTKNLTAGDGTLLTTGAGIELVYVEGWQNVKQKYTQTTIGFTEVFGGLEAS